MAKKKKKFQETTIEDFYDLKVDKVDELVAALKGEDTGETDDVSLFISDCTGVDDPKNYSRFGKQKQFDPYRTDFLGKVPTWIKAIFIKWWFAGVVCFFVNMGLGIVITATVDLVVISGLVMGLVTELLVNPLYRFLESDKKEYNNYMMFPFSFKAYWTFFTNMLYYLVVTIGINVCYHIINTYMFSLAIEPLLFGVFAVIVDMIFIGVKDLIVFIVRKFSKKETPVNV